MYIVIIVQKYFIAFKNYYLAVLLLLKYACIYRNISLKPVTLIFSSLTLLIVLLYHKIKNCMNPNEILMKRYRRTQQKAKMHPY